MRASNPTEGSNTPSGLCHGAEKNSANVSFQQFCQWTRVPEMLCWKGELSLKMNNSSPGKLINSLLESQIKDLQGFVVFLGFFCGRKLCDGLADTDWYKRWFKISCAKPEGKWYTCAQGGKFWRKFISCEKLLHVLRLWRKKTENSAQLKPD